MKTLRHRLIIATIVLVSGVLTACGGGKDSPPANEKPPITAEALFVPENAWQGPLPAGAQTVSPEEFVKGFSDKDLVLVNDASQQKQGDEAKTRFQANRAFLDGLSDRSPALDELLTQARQSTDGRDSAAVTLPGGQTLGLLDLATRLDLAVESYRQARDLAQLIKNYELSYSLLPTEQKGQLGAPASLNGKTLEQIRQALAQLDTVLATLPDLDNTRPEPPLAVTLMKASPAMPGNGADGPASCTPRACTPYTGGR